MYPENTIKQNVNSRHILIMKLQKKGWLSLLARGLYCFGLVLYKEKQGETVWVM
jgi:predicted transcriptional regulator of viral defense system